MYAQQAQTAKRFVTDKSISRIHFSPLRVSSGSPRCSQMCARCTRTASSLKKSGGEERRHLVAVPDFNAQRRDQLRSGWTGRLVIHQWEGGGEEHLSRRPRHLTGLMWLQNLQPPRNQGPHPHSVFIGPCSLSSVDASPPLSRSRFPPICLERTGARRH
ncbi:unnamed protein product [Pleuronectes platessa]|uniref:Uncharacterized protein n=1 Tax=Pleuronectes platessa TaxID=8262 RepID=A0A9N7YQS2_PLEPL|nr:unnamed protein product [Pleuronectes platessa]